MCQLGSTPQEVSTIWFACQAVTSLFYDTWLLADPALHNICTVCAYNSWCNYFAGFNVKPNSTACSCDEFSLWRNENNGARCSGSASTVCLHFELVWGRISRSHFGSQTFGLKLNFKPWHPRRDQLEAQERAPGKRRSRQKRSIWRTSVPISQSSGPWRSLAISSTTFQLWDMNVIVLLLSSQMLWTERLQARHHLRTWLHGCVSGQEIGKQGLSWNQT